MGKQKGGLWIPSWLTSTTVPPLSTATTTQPEEIQREVSMRHGYGALPAYASPQACQTRPTDLLQGSEKGLGRRSGPVFSPRQASSTPPATVTDQEVEDMIQKTMFGPDEVTPQRK